MKLRFALAAAALLAAPALAEDLPAPRAPDQSFAPELNSELRVRPVLAENCRDKIQTVRAERGLPILPQRDATAGNEVLHTYAVDRRIDGCNVMVMANGSGDVRPLPEIDENTPLLRPLQ